MTDEDDLCDIMEELESMISKWRTIGMALGLKQDVLDAISHAPQNDDQMLMTKMLTEWLKRNYNVSKFGKPTWEKLVKVVKARVGGNNTALAQAIAVKHSG